MISLDANIILRFLLNDVPSQTARAKILFSKPSIYVSDVVVSKVVFVLEKVMKFERAYISLLLRTLTALPNLIHNNIVLPEAIALFETRKKLFFVDCYASIEAKKFGGIAVHL
jgi:predicted nucleic-acid-binding protein